MRRSTAAAVGTLTGAALIVGVRLSVSAPAPSAVGLAGSGGSAATSARPKPPAKQTPAAKKTKKAPPPAEQGGAAGANGKGGAAGADASGLKDGTYRGDRARNPYGTVQVSIKITGGRIVAAGATYPTSGESGEINRPAVARLKQATLKAQSAEVDAVSGATFTSESYVKSLQAALDRAGG